MEVASARRTAGGVVSRRGLNPEQSLMALQRGMPSAVWQQEPRFDVSREIGESNVANFRNKASRKPIHPRFRGAMAIPLLVRFLGVANFEGALPTDRDWRRLGIDPADSAYIRVHDYFWAAGEYANQWSAIPDIRVEWTDRLAIRFAIVQQRGREYRGQCPFNYPDLFSTGHPDHGCHDGHACRFCLRVFSALVNDGLVRSGAFARCFAVHSRDGAGDHDGFRHVDVAERMERSLP